MKDRIIQLESLSAMQDETIKNLHQELFAQQKELGQLSLRIKQMEQKLAELPEPGQTGGNERPPHW